MPAGLATLMAVAVLASTAAAAAHGSGPPCERVAGNLIANCGFARGIEGWRSQAVTSLAFERGRGFPSPGSLRMTNQPASEAGAATCVAVGPAVTVELRGYLHRLDGPGECLPFVEEHTALDCGDGATAFHDLGAQPLLAGSFTGIGGTVGLRRDTVAVRAGFACYGEEDDDVQSVLLDDVTLRRIESAR
jgi:hypothetical protein